MKKKYIKAEASIIAFENESVITASGVSGLKYGGEKGKGESEGFGSMFGEN
ncbi:MAG: hypothetical protein Q4F63_08435 [Clostridia bacterium]|nr:hypothetical protein [Clostridia bacterium]